MIAGYTVLGAAANASIGAGRFIGLRLKKNSRLAKVTVALDGKKAGGLSPSWVRAAVYTVPGRVLVAASDTIMVEADTAFQWYDFTFPDAGKELPAGRYSVGFLVNGGDALRHYLTSVATNDNRWTNPSAEASSLGNVSATGAVVTQSTERPKRDAHSFKLVADGGAVANLTHAIITQNTSDTISLRGQVNAAAPGLYAQAVIELLNSSNVLLDTILGTPVALVEGSWVEPSAQGSNAGSTRYRAHIRIGVGAGMGNLTAGQTVYVDEVGSRRTSLVNGPYMDANEDIGLWSATENASLSMYGGSATYSASQFTTPPAQPTLSSVGPAAMYLTYYEDEDPAAVRDAEELGALGHESAVAALSAPGFHRAKTFATCGWHGSRLGPEGQYALVDTEGPLADLVGDVVRVNYEAQSTVVYVYGEAGIAEDISLARRAFLDLAPLSTDELEVTLELRR